MRDAVEDPSRAHATQSSTAPQRAAAGIRARCASAAVDRVLATPPPTPRHALLLNPWYRKGRARELRQARAHAVARAHERVAATPPHWSVEYHDENLLRPRPPDAPFPAVVGISVHLTLARRAFELAQWYRRRGAGRARRAARAVVSRRVPAVRRRARGRRRRAGLGAAPRRRRGRPAAAALPRRVREPALDLSRRPGAAPLAAAARRLPHDHEPDRDARLPQPLRLLLPRDRRAPPALSGARPGAGRRRVRGGRRALRRLRRQQPGLAPRLPSHPLPRVAAGSRGSGARGGP